MSRINKQGQALGRKGAESRARLLDAARDMIAGTAVDKFTASAIARTAGLASQTFYLYFTDVDELLLSLAAGAGADITEILDELDLPWTDTTLDERAERFIAAFYRYWDRHRAILNVRNFRAEMGHADFLRARDDAAMPIVSRLAARIGASQADSALGARDALARAIVIFAAIERMASRYPIVEAASLNADDLKRAEAHILRLMLAPPTT